MAELEVRDLTVEFNTAGGYVLRPLADLSFDADDGELVVVLGPSGCGKTTLPSCLAGLLTPKSGTVTFRGEEITSLAGNAGAAYRRHTVGVVFQGFNLIPSARSSSSSWSGCQTASAIALHNSPAGSSSELRLRARWCTTRPS